MTNTLLIVLFVMDAVLLIALVLISKRQTSHSDLLHDLTEERRLLSELRNSVKDELTQAQVTNRDSISKVRHLAAEAEQEVKNCGNSLADGMEGIVTELGSRFDKPLRELARKQASVEILIQKADIEKDRLLRIIKRGEKLAKFFDSKTSFDEVLKDMENTKYESCRKLLGQGVSTDRIADELGISKSEVTIISSLC